MFYRLVRATISFALQLFYRIKVIGQAEPGTGAVVFVSNHPNSLLDPALLLMAVRRPVTFLAKEPLFRTPGMGWLLRWLDALPVYRKQDHPEQMDKNEGTLEAAAGALLDGRAITLFPEGKSHSEPQLAEIKTGCARIALRAAGRGVGVQIVPVGLTYAEKHRFRSAVLVEVGRPIAVAPAGSGAENDVERVRHLTDEIASGLRQVTLNLERWEELPILDTAEALYSFRLGEREHMPDRLRRFARGMEIFRAEQPERFEQLRGEVMEFRRRLELVHASPTDLAVQYRRSLVYPFIVRNTLALMFGFPLFAVGVLIFSPPFLLTRVVSRVVRVAPDRIATLKFVVALFMAPLWATVVAAACWKLAGPLAAVAALVAATPFAVFTRYFLERRRAALRDVVTFLVLGSRARLKARLLVEGERLSREIEALAGEYRQRVTPGEAVP